MSQFISNNDNCENETNNIYDIKLDKYQTRGECYSAMSTIRPNTIVLRDCDGATKLSSVFLNGANYLNANVPDELLTNAYLYLSNKNKSDYAILRNIGEPNLSLSLDIGKNNLEGNFSIRTIENNIPTTNLTIKNNKIGINNSFPIESLDVNGNVLVSNNLIINGVIKTKLSEGVIFSNSNGDLFSGLINDSNIENYSITSNKLQDNISLSGIPTCESDETNLQSIANVQFVKSQIENKMIFLGYKIVHIITNDPIVFDFYLGVVEIERDIELPENKEDGYKVNIINKCGNTILIKSTEQMFNAMYSPYGSNEFILVNHRQISLIFIHSDLGNSWLFTHD
jgi:hypothetical protein